MVSFYNVNIFILILFMDNFTPIEQTLILTSKEKEPVFFNNKGGSYEDVNDVLKYLEGVNLITTKSSDDWGYYEYEIITDDDNNDITNKYSNKYNTYYLANGYNMTVVLIKCKNIKIRTEPIKKSFFKNKCLVIKYKFVNNHEKNKKNYNEQMKTIYIKFKKKFDKLLGNLYFYGDIYENKLLNENLKKNLLFYDVKTRKYKKKVIFQIFEYFSQQWKELNKEDLIKFIINICGVLVYLNNEGYYITDFKTANIAYDKEMNLKCIDYDNDLFMGYLRNKDNKKFKYYSNFNLPVDAPCYLIKFFYSILKDDIEYVKNGRDLKRLSNNDTKNTTYNENIRYKNKIIEYIKTKDITSQDHPIEGYLWINSNTDLYLDKVNSISLGKIIFDLFFESIYYIDKKTKEKVKGNFRSFIIEDKIYKKNNDDTFEELKLNKHCKIFRDESNMSRTEYFLNLEDTNLLTTFFYHFIQPKKEEFSDICNYLKPILFDPISKTGLFSPFYEKIPDYKLVFKYILEYNKSKDTPDVTFEKYVQVVNNNIKSMNYEEIGYIDFSLDYITWLTQKRQESLNCIKVSYDDKKYPLEKDLILYKENQLHGGKRGDNLEICEFYGGIDYIETCSSSHDNNKVMYKILNEQDEEVISNKYNEKNKCYYLFAGYYSSVVAIKCIQTNNKLYNKILVLKNTFFREKSDIEMYRWNCDFVNLYNIYIEKFNKLIPEMYYYGDNFYDNSFNKIIPENKKIGFSIFQYYEQNIGNDIEKLSNIFLNIVGIITYLCYKGYYVDDLKLENLGFEGEKVKFIDISYNLFIKFKVNKEEDDKFDYAYYYNNYNIPPDIPCYLMKYFYNLTKDNYEEIIDNNNLIQYTNDVVDNKIYNENKRFSSLIIKESKKNSYTIKRSGYIYTNFNLGYEKINSISLVRILIKMFFGVIYYKRDDKYIEGGFKSFILEDYIFVKKSDNSFKSLMLNKKLDYKFHSLSNIARTYNFQNLEDINLIEKFVYDFLEPLEDSFTDYCNYIKVILYNPKTKKGLLAPKYEDVLSYSEVFQYLYYYKNDDNKYYEKYLSLIKENIDNNDTEIENIFDNNLEKININNECIKVVYE